MNKYRAKKTTVDGVKFDSQKEARRFQELKLLQRLGTIRNLEFQPKFPMIINGIKVCDYIADASYFEGQKWIVEDTKSAPTKTPVYKLKRKLFFALFPHMDHREV